MSRHLIIAGAGPCGLYGAITALRAGWQVTVLEKEACVGGLAASRQRGGNNYDLGVHMLHEFDKEVFETCAEALGDARIEVPLDARIKWAGKLYHYPLRGRDILAGIPPLTLARCLTGLFVAELRSRVTTEQGETAEDALQEMYGVPLYEYFFEGFTHRYWGRHPRELSAEFVRRKMPRLSAVDVVKNACQKFGLGRQRDEVEGALRFETLHYSEQGSGGLQEALGEMVRRLGGKVILEAEVKQVNFSGNGFTSVETVKGSEIKGDAFLSTMPLPLLAERCSEVPEKVLEASQRLSFKPMVVLGLLVKRSKCMDALYTYYRDRMFHRVGEPKNAGVKVTPEDHTILIVEKTCEVGDKAWVGSPEFIDAVKEDLAAEGLCETKEVLEVNVLTERYAYPVFSLGFEEDLGVVQEFLSHFRNVVSTGRQGAFTYPNMHSAMRMGADAVTRLSSI